MAIQFPSSPSDQQEYPDIPNGDTPLDNGRVYVYDASSGVWNIKPIESTPIDLSDYATINYVDDAIDDLGDVITFKGALDFTTEAAPDVYAVGDAYANTADGIPDSSWGISTLVSAGDLYGRGETQWAPIGSSSSVEDLDNYATTEYVDGLDEKNVKLDSGDNITTNNFRLKSRTGKTLLSASGGEDIGIYNLRDPGEASHALNLGYADGRYAKPADLDDLDDKYVFKSGDDITGVLNLTAKDQANNDGVRFYVRDTDGDINVSMTPSGTVEIYNILRLKKSGTGDVLQVRDGRDGSVVSKLTADGNSEFRKITLTGGSSADRSERVLNVKSGVVGRLAYNANTRLTWGSSQVLIGGNSDVGDSDTTITLNLQDNPITNVGSIVVNSKANSSSSTKYFTIKGTLEDGTDDSVDFFYAYHNTGDGSPDAINYNGKIDSNANIVNKKYVDDAIAGVSVTGDYLPLTGGTLTGNLTANLMKSVRPTTGGYAFEVNPSDVSTTTALIRTNGSMELRPLAMTNATDIVFAVKPTDFSSNRAFYIQANGKVKAGHSSSAAFVASENNDVLTKKYSDDKLTHGKFKITSSGGNYYIEPN